jgi:hypothetical protein
VVVRSRTNERWGEVDRSTWRVGKGPDKIGSGLLETRLAESLEHLSERFGVTVPPGGRHTKALETLQRWNQADDPVNLSDVDEIESITAAHRLTWETFLITVAAIEDRRNRETPFTQNKLQAFVRGHLTEEGRDGHPRDIQFELFVAAHFRLPGFSVYAGEPDLLLYYGKELVGVAAKRVRSLNPDQVQKRARHAAGQIEATGRRGWIAMNLDSRFAEVNYDQSEDAVVRDFETAFDAVEKALQRAALKKHVLGFLLFGYVHAWRAPDDGSSSPQIHFAPPLRWFRLVDEPGDAEFFEEFSKACSDRMGVRLKTLASKDFTGLL